MNLPPFLFVSILLNKNLGLKSYLATYEYIRHRTLYSRFKHAKMTTHTGQQLCHMPYLGASQNELIRGSLV